MPQQLAYPSYKERWRTDADLCQRQGYYQEWGKDPVEMTPGTVINIPANVKHWHGAAPDSWFSHLSVEVAGEATSAEWLEAVSEEDYCKLKYRSMQ